jgi:hypothetical protein
LHHIDGRAPYKSALSITRSTSRNPLALRAATLEGVHMNNFWVRNGYGQQPSRHSRQRHQKRTNALALSVRGWPG